MGPSTIPREPVTFLGRDCHGRVTVGPGPESPAGGEGNFGKNITVMFTFQFGKVWVEVPGGARGRRVIGQGLLSEYLPEVIPGRKVFGG